MMIETANAFIVGILPGLGGPTALVLMLPFIIKMKPVEAFAFLLWVTAVTATTGDITSVLFGVPIPRGHFHFANTLPKKSLTKIELKGINKST